MTMNNKIYSILLIAICMLIGTSCDNYLDIQPKGIVIPKKCEDYEALLNYAQLMKSSDNYPNWLTDDVFIPDVDDMTGGYESLALKEQNLYSFQSETFGDGETDNIWTYGYNRIYYYNVIIEDIMNSTDATEQHKLQVQAEALMGRAFEYLILINAYAKHYDPTTASNDPGVPLMLTKNINQSNLERASVQAVYDQIKKDLDEAAKSLPAKPVNNVFRASKPVGYGMLARMYLCMGNYKEALKNAELSLEVNSSLLDLKLYKVIDPEKSIGRLDVPQRADNPENIYVRVPPQVYYMNGGIYGSDELISLFDKENDMRYKLYFTRYLGGVTCDYDLWAPYIYANMAMATPEIYLIAAECEARIGSKDKALKYLDQLRNNRINNNVELSAANNDEALKLVLDERRRELAIQGCTRLIDLKRLNREPQFAKTVIHVINGKEYKLEPNDPKYILPIPLNVLRFNPDMIPNER